MSVISKLKNLSGVVTWVGTIEPPVGGSQAVSSAVVTVSSAQIKAMFDTPIQLVAAPGAGKALVPCSVVALITGSVPYTMSDLPTVQTGVGFTGVSFGCTAMSNLLTVGDHTTGVSLDTGVNAGSTSDSFGENQPITLAVDDANPQDGDGTMIVTILYLILDV